MINSQVEEEFRLERERRKLFKTNNSCCDKVYVKYCGTHTREIHGCEGLWNYMKELQANPGSNPKAINEVQEIIKNCPNYGNRI